MRKLLVVVDYQNDFVEGALGFPKAKTLDSGIAQTIQTYLMNGDCVLFTYDTHTQQYLQTREGKKLPVAHCISHTEGWQLYGETRKIANTDGYQNQIYRIEKPTFGMPPAALDAFGKTIGEIQDIIVVGVVTNMCVISNAIMLQAQWPEAQITIDAALCAGFDENLHEKALDIMESLQMQVIHRS